MNDIILLLVSCVLFCAALLGMHVFSIAFLTLVDKRTAQINDRVTTKIDYLHRGH